MANPKYLCKSLVLIAIAAAFTPAFAQKAAKRQATPPPQELEQCIIAAAEFHSVNPAILRAILKVESNLNPTAFGRNRNGTVDIGIGQINSMHLPELAKYGVTVAHLYDGCSATYVAAWHLKTVINANGNTLQGIAAYHSKTPYFNQRYQIMLSNELVKAGVIEGTVRAVPVLYR